MTMTAAQPNWDPASMHALEGHLAVGALLGVQDRHRAPAGNHALQRPPLPQAPADVVDELHEGEAEGQLVVAGLPDMSADAEELGARGFPRCRWPGRPSAPSWMMKGTEARVSTLFTVEGIPMYPAWAGKGGFTLGVPLRPSREFMRAVSSPQM